LKTVTYEKAGDGVVESYRAMCFHHDRRNPHILKLILQFDPTLMFWNFVSYTRRQNILTTHVPQHHIATTTPVSRTKCLMLSCNC